MSKSIFRGLIILLIASSLTTHNVLAQNCKPDNSRLDKITKQQLDEWSSVLYAPGIFNNAMKNSNVKIAASIIRMGDINKIALVIIRTQEKINTTTVDQYRGAKGNEFYFGFKDGTPIKFVVDEVTNKSDVVGDIGVNSIILFSAIKDEDLKTIKEGLTAKSIDAVRATLENGITVEQSVKDKDGAKMQVKFNCFFSFAQEKGYMK
ncbi:MAG: hypothetical protein M0Q26_15060 [Chitinophagaceae bacterium]|nr:hypothetical protein [Chitinophagaceae bacterium]